MAGPSDNYVSICGSKSGAMPALHDGETIECACLAMMNETLPTQCLTLLPSTSPGFDFQVERKI